MNHTTKLFVIAASCFLIVGCGENKKSRIAMLEESNQRLMDELNSSRSDTDAMAQRNADLEGRLAAAQGENSNLRNQANSTPPPVVPDGWVAVPGGAMIAIDGELLFSPGKANIRKAATRTIDSIVSAVRSQYGEKDILVYGHTDDYPIKKSGWKDNLQLSMERSAAVVRALGDRGIDRAKLVACGCGEHRPRVPNSSDANRKTNRRVEIFALDAEVRTASR